MNAVNQVNFSHKTDSYIFLHDLLKARNKWVLIVDENTEKMCKDLFLKKVDMEPFDIIVVPSGEKNKNLRNIEVIYEKLISIGADRKTILVSLGGGVLSDMIGFAAATFKRGIDYVNVPTSLLAMVDASLGGKTGVNFRQSKNQIGSFHQAINILIDVDYLSTLPFEEVLSGYAEIVKHALIKNAQLWHKLKGIKNVAKFGNWSTIIEEAASIKLAITALDPLEKGERKLLNFGHTVGHALESKFIGIENAMSHGHAVALGMICESELSFKMGLLEESDFLEVKEYLKNLYELPILSSEEISSIIPFLMHDKKNEDGRINFTLLNGIGKGVIDNYCEIELIKETLIATFTTSHA